MDFFLTNINRVVVLTLVDSTPVSQVVLVVKNPPANAGDIRDAGLIEESVTTHSTFLACRIPRTEEPCGLQFLW